MKALLAWLSFSAAVAVPLITADAFCLFCLPVALVLALAAPGNRALLRRKAGPQ